MKTIKLNEQEINKVPNVNGCTNFGGLAFRGNKLFTIKTRQDETMSVISEFVNARGDKIADHEYPKGVMHHGNGLTYYRDELYVAPCASYCELVSTKDWSHKRLKSDVPISGITHYTGNKFIVSRKYKPRDKNLLTIVRRDGNRLIKVSSWVYKNPYEKKGFTHIQGICYRPSKKRLYIVFSREDLKQNIVLRYKVNSADPDWSFESKEETVKKYYEFEGIGFNKDEEMIIGANLPTGDVLFTRG